MIIIEGHDNSGKSTLAKALADYLGYTVQESEGPPRSADEINRRCVEYLERAFRRDSVIWVRHPVISNAIYGSFREEGDPIRPEIRAEFYRIKNRVLIYCDPLARGLSDHVVKPHDTRAHLKLLELKHTLILDAYRKWAIENADIMYRIGDNMQRVMSMAKIAENI
jgi:hypothetical protein